MNTFQMQECRIPGCLRYYTKLSSTDSRLRSLDSIDKQLLCINGKISALESRLGDNENTVKSIHKTVSDLEECKNYDAVKLSELCDDQKRLDHTQSQIQNELRKTIGHWLDMVYLPSGGIS